MSAAERTCDKNGHCRYPCECQHGGDGDGLFIQGERVPVRTSNSCWGDGLHSSTRTGGDLSLSAEPPAEAPEDALTWKCLKGLLLRMFCTRICRAEAEGLAAAPCSHVPASVRDNPAASRMIAFSEM